MRPRTAKKLPRLILMCADWMGAGECPDDLYHVTEKLILKNRMRLVFSNPEVSLADLMGPGTASNGRRPSKPHPISYKAFL